MDPISRPSESAPCPVCEGEGEVMYHGDPDVGCQPEEGTCPCCGGACFLPAVMA